MCSNCTIVEKPELFDELVLLFSHAFYPFNSCLNLPILILLLLLDVVNSVSLQNYKINCFHFHFSLVD